MRRATAHARGDDGSRHFTREAAESAQAFHGRIVAGSATGAARALPAFADPVFACLIHGDLALPDGSSCYALFREQQMAVIAASDLLS